MNVRRRGESVLQPGNAPIKGAVNQRKDMRTMPMDIKNTISTARDAQRDNVKGTVNDRKT